MTAFVDTNIIIRHLTADPPAAGKRATRFLADAEVLLLPDVIAAEIVFVLESFYEVPRAKVASLLRLVIALEAIRALIPGSCSVPSRCMSSTGSTSPMPTWWRAPRPPGFGTSCRSIGRLSA